MEVAEGMVAVVRGLKDSGLTVTLLDGTKQYTLMPNSASAQPSNVHSKYDIVSQQSDTQDGEQPARRNSAAQATDGRYASVYKMAHCRMSPTSPPVQLTEFPPQKAEVCRGQGNFEVGGNGSGESYIPCKSNGSFRGGMNWPDRGSVCSPRPSREPDAFANSLRKYPNVSPERSTEVVERLINYTQAKHLAKSYQSRNSSPSHQGIEYNIPSQDILDRGTNRSYHRSFSYLKSCDRNINAGTKVRSSLEESPTRDIRPMSGYNDRDYADRRLRNSDLKYGINMSNRACDQPFYFDARGRYDQTLFGQKASPPFLTQTKSVNMEVQAAVEMVSREVTTVPKSPPERRTVAVPLSPSTSSDEQKRKGEVSVQVVANKTKKAMLTYKHAQASVESEDLSVQVMSTSEEQAVFRNATYGSYCFYRQSELEEKLINNNLENELESTKNISDVPKNNPEISDLRRKILKRMSCKLQSLTKNLGNLSDRKMATTGLGKTLQFTPVWVPWGEIQFYTDVSTDIIKNNTQQLNTFTKVYRTSVQSFLIKSQLQQLNIIIKDWIKSLPITTNNSSKCVSDAKVIDMKRIQRIIFQKLKHGTPHEMQAELFNLISNIPMNIQDSLKISYLNQVITSFMKKIRQMTFPNYIGRRNYNIYNIENKTNYNVFKQHNQITKHGLVKITADHLNTYFSNNNLLLDDQGAKYFQTELIDILLQSMQEICDDNVMDVIEEIVLLFGETSRATDNEARIFANQLLAKIKKVINNSILNRTFKDSSINTHSKNYIILQNTSWNKLHHNISNSDISDHQKSLGNKGNVDSTDTYLNQLTQQIEEWLQNSQLNIPANDTRLRQIVIHDLAGDIIDRYKYLCLNVSKRGSDEDEIENLKYQIFKWINKLAGEDNMETLNHAPELMRRIQSIPVPKALQTNDSFKNESLSNGCMMKDCSQSANFQRYSFTRSEMRPSKGFISNTKINSSNISNSFNKRMSKCQQSPSGPSINNGRSMRQLNDEYDDFLKNWVKDLPIPSESSEEQEIAEKARQGIYNGVWKTLVKLKLDPDIFHNVFYYEDALDDELEELLKCLPDTPEIKAKKHLLKVNLIEKTTNTNEKIKSSFAPESYKQQLVENVARDLPLKNRTGTSVNNNNQISEVLQIHKIVDDYILCVNYKETDHSKAEVYRNKLIKEAYILIENMKKTYGQDLKDIDTNLYVNNVLNALQKVPMPQDVIEKEANEIQVSQEVDHWFTDLQVVCRNDHTNKRDKNKIKQALVKKVLELQKDVNIFDCSGKEIIKNEISLFLEKMPMEETNINLDFIAEELTTRLKNKAKDLETSNKRKSVAFLDSVGFYEFSLQMPACSSFSEMPLRPALFDQSSYDIKDGSKVILPSPRNFSYGYNRPPYEIPSNEFFTLEDSQASKPVLNQPAVDNKNFQVEDYPNIMHPKPNPWSKQSQQSAYEDGIRKSPDHVIAQGLPANQSIVRDHITSMSKINQSLNQVSSSVENQEPMKKTCCIRNNQQVIMKSPLIASQEFPENENGINNVPQMMLRPENNISVQQSNIINTSSSVSPYGQGFEGTNRVVGIPQMRINSLTPVSSQPQSNINQRIPIIVETPSRLGFHQQPEQSAHHEVFNSTGNRNLQGSSTTYGQPQGFSTPQNQIPLQEYPLRPDKKNSRRQQISLGNIAQRRLDLHDESSNALDGDESCPCFKRVRRCRRKPHCYAPEDFGIDELECYPFPYSCPYFYKL